MPSTFIFVTIVFIFAASIAVAIIFLMSGEEKTKRKKKKPEEMAQESKDWPLIVQRLEKHSETLKKEIEGLEKVIRGKDKDLGVEKLKNSQLQAKLAQEKSWREKEQGSIDKRNEDAHQFKGELLKAEKIVEEEHSLRLRLERELTEAKREVDSLSENKRLISSKLQQIENSLDQYMKEVVELRRTNAQLKKKNEDTTWISKVEYDKLEKLFKEKEKELERLKREIKA